MDDEDLIESPQMQTRGVKSTDVLATVMGVDPVPPEIDEALWVQQYRNLIEEGKADGPEALSLRQKVVAHFGVNHPVIGGDVVGHLAALGSRLAAAQAEQPLTRDWVTAWNKRAQELIKRLIEQPQAPQPPQSPIVPPQPPQPPAGPQIPPRAVLLKRGPSATVDEWLLAAEYILDAGNPNVMLCERGIRTFEAHTRFTLPLASAPYVQEKTHLPIVMDPSHGTGHTTLVTAMARASVAAGADGIIVEVHPNPDKAMSDGYQSLNFPQFEEMMKQCRRIATRYEKTARNYLAFWQ